MKQNVIKNSKNKLKSLIIKLFHSLGMEEMNSHLSKKDFTNFQRFSLIILYVKENKSLRQFTNDLEHSKWTNYLQLKKIPKKSTLNSWFKFFKIEKIKNLVKNFLFKNKIFAIDGTGLETSKRTNYFQKRLNDFGLKTKQNYNKLDIIADIDSKLIYDFSFLEKQRHDAFIGRKLLKNFNLKNKLILGDGAYDCEKLHKICFDKQNKLISPLRKNSFKQRHKKLSLRNKLAKNFPKKTYNKRCLIESIFSSLKRVQLNNLRMKRREIEICWNILYYNIRKSISLLFLKFQNFFLKFLVLTKNLVFN